MAANPSDSKSDLTSLANLIGTTNVASALKDLADSSANRTGAADSGLLPNAITLAVYVQKIRTVITAGDARVKQGDVSHRWYFPLLPMQGSLSGEYKYTHKKEQTFKQNVLPAYATLKLTQVAGGDVPPIFLVADLSTSDALLLDGTITLETNLSKLIWSPDKTSDIWWAQKALGNSAMPAGIPIPADSPPSFGLIAGVGGLFLMRSAFVYVYCQTLYENLNGSVAAKTRYIVSPQRWRLFSTFVVDYGYQAQFNLTSDNVFLTEGMEEAYQGGKSDVGSIAVLYNNMPIDK